MPNPKPVLRCAELTDVSALSGLAIETYTAAFGHTFTPPDLASHLERHLTSASFSRYLEEDVILLAELECGLVGYIQFGQASVVADSGKDQELRRLYVLPEFQGRGIGSALMDAALRHPRLQAAENIFLDVWEHNEGARRLYERHGFEVVGTRAFEVESGAETSLDLVMVRRAVVG